MVTGQFSSVIGEMVKCSGLTGGTVLKVAICLASLILISAAAPLGEAQELNGSIEGIIRDSTGGLIPGVTVDVRGPSLVGVADAMTDERGLYRFPALPPGVYEVTARECVGRIANHRCEAERRRGDNRLSAYRSHSKGSPLHKHGCVPGAWGAIGNTKWGPSDRRLERI